MSLLDLFKKKGSGDVAKDRLKLLLVSDRANCSPEVMEMIKNVTQKFIDFNLKISGKIFPEKFNNLLKKFLTVEVVLYIFFGVLTTVVNIGSFAIITSCFKLEENISNAIAIILAVLFAYFTNKDLVFNSKAESFKEKILEFFKFMLGRAFTMFVELIGFYLLFNILGIQKLISKTLITVIVIILNFFISKFFAFKK